MDKVTYERMMDMAMGRVPRDQGWLDEQARLGHVQEEAQAKAKYEREHPPARSRREIELEQRAFNLRMFGKSGMEKYAQPLDDMGELYIPSIDSPGVRVVQEHSAEQRPIVPAHLKLKGHSSGGLRYSEPIKQKLELRRG